MLVHCQSSEEAVPLWFVTKQSWPKIKAGLPGPAQAFASACSFEPAPGRHMILPNSKGGIASVIFGLEAENARARELFLPGELAAVLPAGVYRFANSPYDAALAALAWELSSYRFGRYKANSSGGPKLRVFPMGWTPQGLNGSRAA
jgi:leucyl aminopeptidase